MSSLSEALLEARKNMGMPPLNGVGHAGRNGAREYRYALLQDVLKCVVPPLLDQGVLLTQGFSDGRLVTSVTKGDETIRLDVRDVNMSGTSQEQGSAETYAKRYALCSAFCIAGMDDDDGQAASAPTVKKQNRFTKLTGLKAEAMSLGISEEGIKTWMQQNVLKGKPLKDATDKELSAIEQHVATLISDKKALNGDV